MEEDNDNDRKGVVSAIMSLIYGSRSGLYQDTELEPLLAARNIGILESGVQCFLWLIIHLRHP